MSRRNSQKAAKAAKRHPVLSVIIVIVAIIAVACVLFYFYKREPSLEKGSAEEIKSADFSVHFLDVGNCFTGDCILIDCGETEALIDAGSRKSSAPVLTSYIDGYCADGKLEYVIATHSDQDHISAFLSESGKDGGIFDKYEIGTLIMFDKSRKDRDKSSLLNEFYEAVETLPESTAVYTASQCYDETDGASRQYYLNEEKTLSINILYNYYYYNVDKSNENNHSVVTLLTYEGETEVTHCLFTGDLEEKGEKKLAEYYKDPSNSKSKYDVLPEVDLFKAGHHGSYTASGEELLSIIKPKYVAVSCCAGSNEYAKDPGHYFPAQEFIDRISPYTDKIYCTNVINADGKTYSQMNGNIVFYNKNGLKLYCSNGDTVLKDAGWFKANRKWNGA